MEARPAGRRLAPLLGGGLGAAAVAGATVLGLWLGGAAFQEASAPAPPPTGVAIDGSALRDGQRLEALDLLRQALALWRDDHGAYPSTGGQVQTLCTYREDAGCALGGGLPTDPAGGEGYWYTSDGAGYILFAQRESGEAPACLEHPEHLAHIPALMCVRGP